jgi:uncharacterized membrane protein (DUF485 family)
MKDEFVGIKETARKVKEWASLLRLIFYILYIFFIRLVSLVMKEYILS